MAKMKEIRVTSLMMIMLALMAMLVSPSHAQAVDFDFSCFLKCATKCLSTPTLDCLAKCLTSCADPSPSPSPPSPSPPMPPATPPATPPTFPDIVHMPSPAGLKSCNFECAIRDCTSIETDTEKLKCMENCFKVSCDNN